METINSAFVDASLAAFKADGKNTLALNAMTTHDPLEVLQKRDVSYEHDHNYSIKIENEGKITNQKASGRCWLFACCNVLRNSLIKEYKLPETFELSQTFLFFYDKLERCNFFLEEIIKSTDEPLDGRFVQHLLTCPMNDGGQWEMIVNVIKKYGICPKDNYRDSWSSTASRRFNGFMTAKLREWACTLRSASAGGASVSSLRKTKESFVAEAHRILLIHFGPPPTTFSWKFHDTNKEGNTFKRFDNLTPLSFLKDYVKFEPTSMVSLIHDPRNEYYKTYTVKALGNVAEDRGSFYLNVPIDVLKKYAMETLKGGDPVWFGCDVGQYFNRNTQVMDDKQFDYDLVFGTSRTQNKEDRLRYGESLMTHAMVFTGCDVEPGNDLPAKWRVENSWGSESGDKGYALMSDSWFSEFMYQVVVKLESVDDECKAALKCEPVVLPAWDPMGALA